MAVSENDVAEGGEVTVAAAAFAPVEPDAPAEGEHPVEAPAVRETAGPGRTAAETESVDHQAAPEQSAVRRSARRWSRPARPVIRLAPLAHESPGSAAAEPAPGCIAEPPVLGGRPTLGSVPRALPGVLESAPDSVLDGGTAGGLIARAASLRGDDHRYEGEGRQDSVGLWPLACDTAVSDTGSVLLAAVADGVGSLPLSHLGSAAACRLVRRHAAERLEALVETERTAALVSACRDTAADIAAGMRAAADERGLAAERLATTLVAALVVPAAEGRSARATVFAVGDSSASVLRDGVWWPCLPVEDGTETAEVANAPTYALPAHARQVAVAVTPLQSGDVLALCSDGLARPMLNASVRDRLAEWWGGGRVPSLPEFYWQLSFRAQTFGDDRSVVCVWVP